MNRRTEKLYNAFILNETFYQDNRINENDDHSISQKVKQLMDDDSNWEVNDYDNFVKSLELSKKPGFLTHYTPQELKNSKTQTYKLKGYPIGFGLKPTDDGNIDIISLHNNAGDIGVHGVVDHMLKKAIRHGGNQLDHFDGILSDFYGRNGFKEYDRLKWDDAYAPDNWDYGKYGRPDVVLRRLNKEPINEMLSLIYRMK